MIAGSLAFLSRFNIFNLVFDEFVERRLSETEEEGHIILTLYAHCDIRRN